MTYHLRVLPTVPAHLARDAGRTLPGTFATAAEADELRRAMPNGAHVEVVPIDTTTTTTQETR